MGKKYFFELLDECESQFKGIMVFGLTPRNQISAEIIPEESLTPYTEPDIEQVRKEAYKDGYDAGFGRKIDASYQEGISDAWEAARKICTNWVLPDSVLSEIFGMDKTIDDIMKENTASEAIEKIRAYEQEQNRQARIELNCEEIKDVINTTMKECNVSLDDIAEVLQKMKESDNG